MNIDKNHVSFDGVVYEDVIGELRDALQEAAPESVTFDFTACDDLHLAVMQAIMAYRKLYDAEYAFGDEAKTYRKILEGFERVEDHCH